MHQWDVEYREKEMSQPRTNYPYVGGSPWRITFGKYKGHMICTIPISYLEWLERELLAKGTNTSDRLMIEINHEVKKRGNK